MFYFKCKEYAHLKFLILDSLSFLKFQIDKDYIISLILNMII